MKCQLIIAIGISFYVKIFKANCQGYIYIILLTSNISRYSMLVYDFFVEVKQVKTILNEDRFNFISDEDKEFIVEFDNQISKLGYGSGGEIGSGFCWGRYMIIYSKLGVKNKQVAARIYIRDNNIVLRLYLNNIDKHSKYIENSKPYIKNVFTGEYGNCKHCHNEKNGKCKFRKVYSLDNKFIEKCNGFTFEFWEPNLEKLPDYIELLKEFYPVSKIRPNN